MKIDRIGKAIIARIVSKIKQISQKIIVTKPATSPMGIRIRVTRKFIISQSRLC